MSEMCSLLVTNVMQCCSTLVRCLKQTGRICLGPLRLSTFTLSDALPTPPTLQLHCTATLENTLTGQEVCTCPLFSLTLCNLNEMHLCWKCWLLLLFLLSVWTPRNKCYSGKSQMNVACCFLSPLQMSTKQMQQSKLVLFSGLCDSSIQ